VRTGSPEELAGPPGRGPLAAETGQPAAGAAAEERHRVRRRIVEDPVVLHSSLTPAERDWLLADLGAEAHLLAELTGLHLEVRAEGVLAVDPEGYLTDRHFPGSGTVARIALLAAAELLEDEAPTGAVPDAVGAGSAATGRAVLAGESDAPAGDEPENSADRAAAEGGTGEPGWVAVADERLSAAVAALAQRYPRAWSREAVRDTGRLTRSVTQTLAQVGLARTVPGGTVEISTAVARYRPVPDGPEGADEPEESGGADAGSTETPAHRDRSPSPGQDVLFGL